MPVNWQLIADRLYASLKSMPCRCEKAWQDGNADQVLVKRCSRCISLELYDAAAGVPT